MTFEPIFGGSLVLAVIVTLVNCLRRPRTVRPVPPNDDPPRIDTDFHPAFLLSANVAALPQDSALDDSHVL